MSEELFSPAKLTKYLYVTGARKDGMHELESEMVSLTFGDTLELSDGNGIEIVDEHGWLFASGQGNLTVPTDGSNLIAKALEVVQRSARVRLHKRIPPGAGLGGGSSNAATIFRHFGNDDVRAKVEDMGADITFCLRGGRALARGVGEQLDQLPFEQEKFVLLLSPFGISTRDVYRQYDLVNKDMEYQSNELERAAMICEPRLHASKKLLAKLSGREPILAGSGSTYFVNGTLGDLDLSGEIISDGPCRYADVVDKNENIRYRLVETEAFQAFY